MPKIDFSTVSGIDDFSPIPDGQYLCCLVDAEADVTRSGDEMWKLRWQVEGGEHDGRLVFDYLIFSAKAMPRVKLICQCCGIDTTGDLNLEPSLILKKRVMVEVYRDEFEDDRGQTKVQNKIPFGGYSPVPGEHENVPF